MSVREAAGAQPRPARPGDRSLWLGILVPALAWAANLTVSYSLAEGHDTGAENQWSLLASAVTVLLVMAGAFFAQRGKRLAGGQWNTERRVILMHRLGLGSAAFFLLLTVAMALPNLFFSHRAGS